MKDLPKPKFRIYPSLGIARLGNGKAEKEEVIFSPEVPWANLFETDKDYLTADGALKKQAQRFYIYECDEHGNPTHQINPEDFDIEWTAEVANKKPFWYDFNNSLDLSIQTDNMNLSPNFFDKRIAPGISASLRNPNVLDEGLRKKDGENFRKELINRPGPISVSNSERRKIIKGQFPFTEEEGKSKIAEKMNTTAKDVPLGTLEYDEGTLIFYGGDGISASLNPSDLNTDFADNSNWYDDICDGRITAKITSKKTGETIALDNALSSAWIATAPPDYAPQIQPISTMYDLICGTEKKEKDIEHKTELSMVFPMFYRLYRMQWVNMGDFLSPSFKETIDKLTAEGNFESLYKKGKKGDEIREMVFNLFRNPEYNYDNEPIIPSKDKTDLTNLGSGTEELKLPYYPGDGINYPGSPAQWFAIPPLLYAELKKWRDGHFDTPDHFDFKTIDEMGHFYQQRFLEVAHDPSKKALLMTRAVLETLYGGGFHPGVELTWPLRHKQLYAQNTKTYEYVSNYEGYSYSFFGLREIRLNVATLHEQKDIFFNDFGLLMTPEDVRESIDPIHEKHWLWKVTPGDLTKWMGIPWQSDAGSCQAVFTDSQYPVPAWWAANLPVDVLTEASFAKIKDTSILEETRRNIYANRLPWLHTTDTGYVGYHAEGGYLNGLINMVYQWKDIGVVTGRKSEVDMDGIPEIVYVSYTGDK